MKNYLLFAGEDYYPDGGFKDFLGDFDSIDDAKLFLETNPKTNPTGLSIDWWHIFSLKDARIVEADKSFKP